MSNQLPLMAGRIKDLKSQEQLEEIGDSGFVDSN
jgi:hypothetical protein